MTVAAILKHKGYDIVSVTPETPIAEAVGALAAHRIGALAVLDAAGHLCGILSERDVVQALARHGAAVLAMTTAQLMTAAKYTGTLRTTVMEAMAMMTEGRFRHLPILQDGTDDRIMIGMVSIGDVVKARIMQQETEVDSLKAYVSSAA